MIKSRAAFLSLSCLLLFSSAGLAQLRGGTVEISPFAGYLFGGSFPAGSNGLFNNKVDVEDHFTYGGRIGWNFNSTFEAETQFSRTETHFQSPGGDVLFGPPGTNLGDLTIDYLLGYATFNFGHGRFVPYVTMGMGAARLEPDVCGVRKPPCANPDAEWRYTTSLGGGIKTFFTPHFGMRFDGRWYGTLLNTDDGCHDRHDHCDNHTDWMHNGDITGGLLFAF
jgi:opacity protein-like surface antigen